jgi:hypothetical protein
VRLLRIVAGRTGLSKIDSPKIRGRGQEFHADSLPAIPRLTDKNYPAFLFFQGLRMHQHQHFPVIDFIAQHQQRPVRVHHLGFANFTKLPAIMAAPYGLQPHLMKDALASARGVLQNFAHTPMLRAGTQHRQLPERTGVPKCPTATAWQNLSAFASGLRIPLSGFCSLSLRLNSFPSPIVFREIIIISYKV